MGVGAGGGGGLEGVKNNTLVAIRAFVKIEVIFVVFYSSLEAAMTLKLWHSDPV